MLFIRLGFPAWVVVPPISSVYPSGAARATAADPIAPFAPTLFLGDDGLAETFAELGRDKPGYRVRAAARRQRDDEGDGAPRVVLRVRRAL